jgi:hypothetical protein
MTVRSSRQGRWSLRYYFVFDDGQLFRLPNTTHRKLLDEELAIPKLANQKVRLLEVFVSTVEKGKILDARGSIYSFGPDGKVTSQNPADAVANELDRIQSLRTGSQIIELAPTIRSRKWKAENTWKPSASLLQRVQSDLVGGGSREGKVRTVGRLDGLRIHDLRHSYSKSTKL